MNGTILRTEYTEVMEQSYIDYAMSVIIARALPDVRDGLKPVQRRTLYDMHELGIRYDKPYRKCARIVGDTMGKYHPHGDSSIYEALVVLAQEFKKGITLIDGHGNFGSIEGDSAAAMRYTEARLAKITQQAYLADLDKNVVDFLPNFDETETEPSVLPVKIPNLLINGAEGIAVGMATSIPPHNFSEVLDALKAYMQDPSLEVRELMQYIKGPDFPTGGIVCNKDDLLSIYETGMGKIKLRGKVDVEKGKNGHVLVVISEIPYTMVGANISKFLSDVASLYENKKAPEIVDIMNQSGKDGIRIVIELKKDSDVQRFINMLYKKTKLEDTFGVNMLAVVKGKPETLSLKAIMQHCMEFQIEVATRKFKNLLDKELEKREIQEGLIKACNLIDLIIEILRGSKDRVMAKNCLVQGVTAGIHFKSKESKVMAAQLMFTEKQANAILDMRLYRLIGLEINALVKEHEDTMANIYRYEDILASHTSMISFLIKELNEFRKEYGKDRKTNITNAEEAIYVENKIQEMDVYFIMDRFGYARSIDVATFERNKDTILAENKFIISTKNIGKICIFTQNAQMHTIKMTEVPLGKLRDKGIPIDNISNYDSSKDQIIKVCSQSELNLYRILFVTKLGMCKIVDGGEFDVLKRSIASSKLLPNDEIVSIDILTDKRNIVLQTNLGYFLRFQIDEISEKKKGAIGIRGMKLSNDDFVENVYYTNNADQGTILYKEKEIELQKIKLGKRDTKGTKIRV